MILELDIPRKVAGRIRALSLRTWIAENEDRVPSFVTSIGFLRQALNVNHPEQVTAEELVPMLAHVVDADRSIDRFLEKTKADIEKYDDTEILEAGAYVVLERYNDVVEADNGDA